MRGPRVVDAAWLLMLLFWSSAGAQSPTESEPKPDSLFVSAQTDSLSPGEGGAGGGVLWLHAAPRQTGVEAGVFTFSLDESRWRYLQAGLSSRFSPRAAFSVQTKLGTGGGGGADFTYQVYKGGFVCALAETRLWAEVENQYLHMGDAQGNIVKAGFTYIPAPSLDLGLAYHTSTAGNLGIRYLSARFGLTKRGKRFQGGATFGRSSPEVFNIIANGETLDSRELFLGVGVPLGRYELTVLVDRLDQEGLEKETLIANWRIPLE